uniref:Uncharacterized protein LOC104246109 n=1 Tax=Nicotiana sylvestris TaxID=4096 RepID=A0A1U7YDX9_NICSY|nr:PREDICTED: uncharacterized protein LOC104246109 [Nicotiana sylvestris]
MHFRVSSGKFLGFMVLNRGIEINTDKIKAIEDIAIVDSVKNVQRLTWLIAALGRFISRSSDRSHKFFSLLEKRSDFAWTPECQHALEELKRYPSPPLLYTPKADEKLYLYLAVSNIAPPTGNTIRQTIKTSKLTNNEAKYETIITGLKLAKSLEDEVIEAKCDSQLKVNKVNKTFEVREDRVQRYLDKLQVTLHWFKEWTLQHVPREQNGEAEALANLGSSIEDDEISSDCCTTFKIGGRRRPRRNKLHETNLGLEE